MVAIRIPTAWGVSAVYLEGHRSEWDGCELFRGK